MAWRTQLWGLGVLLGPPSSRDTPGCCHQGRPGRESLGCSWGSSKESAPQTRPCQHWIGFGTHLELQNQGGTGQREMGTEPGVSSALGSRGDKAKALVVLPVGMLGSPRDTWAEHIACPAFWLLQGPQQDPLAELGTTKPQEARPLQMAGEGG